MSIKNKPIFWLKIVVLVALTLRPVGTDEGSELSRFPLLGLNSKMRGRAEVPLEDTNHSVVAHPETENIRQVLRIVDQHYVQRERLDPVRMARSGFVALQREFGTSLDYADNIEPFLRRTQTQVTVLLCPQLGSKNLTFCVDEEQRQSTGKFFLSSGVPAVRVGNRVFHTTQSPHLGMRYVEAVSRPVISALAKAANIPVYKAVHVFLNGVLDELDPHSSFLSSEEYRELRGGTRGQFGGVGLVIDEVQELPVIREIVPNSPAHMAGIKPGDVLLRVADHVVSFLPLENVLKEIRELTVDSPTPVWLYRPTSRRIFRVFLTREEIPTRSVDVKVVLNRPDVFHVRVTGFSNHTSEDVYAAYENAMRASGNQLRLFVLDLRGNPGGLLDQAISVSDLFLKSGKIVSTRSRYDEQVEYASRGQKIDLPLMVLVNSSSASASEIVAGALRDQNRGLIVGERTFGKGSVQSLFELATGTALKLTIAHYFTPSKRSIQSVGVEPHVHVRLVQMKSNALWMSGSSEPEREEHLAFHLENPSNLVMGPLPLRNFEDNGTPVVWAHTQHPLGKVEGLDWLNFSYPSFENTDAATDLNVDPVARVAVRLADEMLLKKGWIVTSDESLADFSRSVQSTEARILRSSAAAESSSAALFQRAADQFFDVEKPTAVDIGARSDLQGPRPAPLIEAVKPVLGSFEKFFARSLVSEHGLNTCCFHEKYTFKLSVDSINPLQVQSGGFVGIRIEDSHEGAVVWVPASLGKQSDASWRVTFQVSTVFRAYLSEIVPDSKLLASFFFKAKFSDPGIYAGSLPVLQRNKSELRKPRSVQVEIHPTASSNSNAPDNPNYPSSRNTAQAAGLALSARMLTERKLEARTLSERTLDQSMVAQFRLPNLNALTSEKYELLIVPLVDNRVEFANLSLPLTAVSTGDLVGEVKFTVKASARSGAEFGGVVGGILRSESGEIIGKWPLFYFRDGVLETAEVFESLSSLNENQTPPTSNQRSKP